MRRVLSFCLVTSGWLAGCSGQLLIEQPVPPVITCDTSADCPDATICDANGECVDSPGRCSAAVPNGDCSEGRVCNNGACFCVDETRCNCEGGTCTVNMMSTWCDCAPNQGCDSSGVCTDIVMNANDCSVARPTGLCAQGDVCVGGFCVPLDDLNSCSADVPNGLCPSGLGCANGFCIPLADNACEAGPDGEGLCPAGQSCASGTPNASCLIQPCNQENPFGACTEAEKLCRAATTPGCSGTADCCADVPCSPNHTMGTCPGMQFCSVTGGCIDDATCAANGDCPGGSFCTVDNTCLPAGSCIETADCTNSGNRGQGFICDTGFCIEQTTCSVAADCIPSKFCSSGNTCRSAGECDGQADCVSGTEFCSVTSQCAAIGTCLGDGDCGMNETCNSSNVCIGADSCATPADCPPNHACNSQMCEPAGTLCDSNTFIASSACPQVGGADQLRCCDPATTVGCCTFGIQRCSAAGNCIGTVQCVDDTDCLNEGGTQFFTCNTGTYFCEAVTSCGSSAECGTNERCNLSGACIPDDRCVLPNDCPGGQTCGPDWRCVPVQETSCDFEELAVGALVPPNMLIVIDRSGSTQLCGSGDPFDGSCGALDDESDCCSPAAGGACADVLDCGLGERCGGSCLRDGDCFLGSETCSCSDEGGGNVCVNDGDCTDGRPCECEGGTPCGSAGSETGTCGPVAEGTPCTSDAQCLTAGTVCDCPNGAALCSPAANAVCVYPCGVSGECRDQTTDPNNWAATCVAASCMGCDMDGDCAAGETCECSNVSGMNACTNDSDCDDGRPCQCAGGTPCTGDRGTCGPMGAFGCGADVGECRDPAVDTRWQQAQAAVDQVTREQEGRINFGLIMYPEPAGDEDCPVGCNPALCTGGPGGFFPAVPDTIDVSVTAGNRLSIMNTLASTQPGGGTPTGGTLRTVLGDLTTAGIGADDRENTILLVTDGEPTADLANVLTCQPPCGDGQQNGNETDVDCGGSCAPCMDMETCVRDRDCESSVCREGLCRPSTCANNMQDGSETGLDCGGPCRPCADGDPCMVQSDCQSQICNGSLVCAAPACDDMMQNGEETAQDCGGACPMTCADTEGCRVDDDCTSGVCQQGICRAGACAGMCGGTCAPCADGLSCTLGTDCQSGVCNGSSVCESPNCTDGVKNGAETDVDCGGNCGPCRGGFACAGNGDCDSETCESCAVCGPAITTPTCPDGFLNGGETDLDCGGSCFFKCGLKQTCDPMTSMTDPDFDCDTGLACLSTADGDKCLPPTCSDGMTNGDETALNCGGSCEPCLDPLACNTESDCQSGVCNTTCQAATCSDGVQNQDETDVDCGGACGATCLNTERCGVDGDCASDLCQSNQCRPAECDNVAFDMAIGETDQDCGGPCLPCAAAENCLQNTDCDTGLLCITTTCSVNPCNDGVQNGDEADVDCGGSVCAACPDGDSCFSAADCGGASNCSFADSAAQACKVDAALDRAYGSDAAVQSFVVGFAFDNVSTNLNCHAAHGRSAQTGLAACSGFDVTNCDDNVTYDEACYYEANDSASLTTAFDNIVQAVASCVYDLGAVPPSLNRLYPYLDRDPGPLRNLESVPAAQFIFNSSTNQIEFLGAACTDLLMAVGAPEPVIIYDCGGAGG